MNLATTFELSQLVHIIKSLPAISHYSFNDISVEDLTCLGGGVCNINFKLCLNGDMLLVRFLLNTDQTNTVCRRQEFNNQRLAWLAGVASEPLAYFAAATLSLTTGKQLNQWSPGIVGVSISKFCPGNSLQYGDVIDVVQLKSLAVLLAKLHDIDVTNSSTHSNTISSINSSNNSNVMQPASARLMAYWRTIETNSTSSILAADDIELIVDSLNNLAIEDNNCLIHGDINPGNIIVNNAQLRLIDWEYSGVTSPYIDLASAIVELALTEQQIFDFINDYQASGIKINQTGLISYISYYCALCIMWYEINAFNVLLGTNKSMIERYCLILNSSLERLK